MTPAGFPQILNNDRRRFLRREDAHVGISGYVISCAEGVRWYDNADRNVGGLTGIANGGGRL